MMTKDFEKYFPLPWEVKIIDTATFIQSGFEPGKHTIKFNADNIAHVDALEYMVKCANLMPEAVEVIRDLIGIAAVLDHGADNAVTRAKQLLAKLEGGNDNEPR